MEALAKHIGELQTKSECRKAWDLIKARLDQLSAVEALRFHKGMKVEFENRKGQTLTGVIETVNQKTATIKIDKVRWRVSFDYLREVRS